MSVASELWWQGNVRDIWQKCCGFIELSLEDFMAIQRRLLLEQLQFLNGCELGRAVMRGARPRNVEEFRAMAPLTTYADYAPYLNDRREDALPEPPIYWQRTSGKSEVFHHKWAPLTQRAADELSSLILAASGFATCKERGVFPLSRNERLLYLMAPPPYVTGTYLMWAKKEFDFYTFPPQEEAINMPFDERIRQGFHEALDKGVTFLFGISGVLVAVAERMARREDRVTLRSLFSRPRALFRLTKGMIRAKLAGRPLMPKDIWSVKGILAGGTDTSVYKDKIREMWGKPPLDVYGSAEASLIAMQTWDYEGMTFVPQLNFLEFVPEEERIREASDPDYRPSTVLLDEVRPGEVYEMVITNFHGGAFTRYRLGDLVKITSLRNEKLGIDLPQMAFYSRADGIIEFANFSHALLTEKKIWQAIENTGIPYEDWVARKEPKNGKPLLHLYVEPRNGAQSPEQLTSAIHEELKKLDNGYAELETLGWKPLEVTFLPEGTFKQYIARQQEAGADLAHLKPPHINAAEGIMDILTAAAPAAKVRRRRQARVPA